jgi:hypothetical protein
VAPVRTDVMEELSASIIRVIRIDATVDFDKVKFVCNQSGYFVLQ